MAECSIRKEEHQVMSTFCSKSEYPQASCSNSCVTPSKTLLPSVNSSPIWRPGNHRSEDTNIYDRQNYNPPQGIHVLNPRTHEYSSLYGRRDSADRIKFRTLRWEDNMDYLGWPNIHHQRDAGGSSQRRKCDKKTEVGAM